MNYPAGQEVCSPKGLDDAILKDVIINSIDAHQVFPEAEWCSPTPLSPLLPVPPLDAELVPAQWKPWIQDVSRRLGCSIEILIINGLSALSILCGRLFVVQPKEIDTEWQVYLTTLWCMVIAPSGSKKSPAMSQAFGPLKAIERENRRVYVEQMKKNDLEISRLKDSLREVSKKSQKNDSSATQGDEQEEIQRRIDELHLHEHRITTQDATTQAIAKILQTNCLGIAVVLDELTAFFHGLERDNRQTDRAFYLMGWNGNQSYSDDTISRGHNRVEHLAININGSIQPKIFKKYAEDLVKRQRHGDGLLPRFQLVAMPENTSFMGEDCEPDLDAKDKYYKCFKAISCLRNEKAKDGFHFQPIVYKFEHDAQLLFKDFQIELQAEVAGSVDHELYHEFVAKQGSTMPLIALLFQIIDNSTGKSEVAICHCLENETKIGLDAARNAAQFCEWLRCTAKSIYSRNIHPANICAHKILEQAQCGNINKLTVAELVDKKWSGITDRALIEEALELLAEHNYLVVTDVPTSGRSRREIRLNPTVFNIGESGVSHGN